MKRTALIVIFCTIASTLIAQPPLPPLGQRWIVNEKYTDEFNGSSLDTEKWYDYHPNWKGRPPGLFMPSQVSVGNGYLKLQGAKMDKDTVIYNWDGSTSIFNVKGGVVVSKAREASFGYYECRFKAAANTMSSTFWFSTTGSHPGPEACNDKYSLEWDVQECIGKEGDFNGAYFAKGMHSNAHFWYTPCEGEKQDLRAEQVIFEDEKLASEQFDVYGGWWHDEYRATYYYNNSKGRSHQFVNTIKDVPFDRPMRMIMAHETYPFPWIRLPTDEELADTSTNYVLYDWVRAYTLTHVDQPKPSEETVMFDEKIFFTDSADWKTSRHSLVFRLAYMANTNREIHLSLLNSDNILVGEQDYEALGGFGHKNYTLELDSVLTPASGYTLVADIRTIEGSEADTFQSVYKVFDLVESIELNIEVLDFRDNSPLENAEIIIAGDSYMTDQTGGALIQDLDPGTIQFIVEKDDFETSNLRFDNILADSILRVYLTPLSYSISFILKNSFTGLVVEDVTVSIEGIDVSSGYNGVAKHTLYAGEYSATVSHPRYADTSLNLLVVSDSVLSVLLKQSLADAKFIISLDDNKLYNAEVALAGESIFSNTVGIAKFNDLKTDTSYTYSVYYDQQLLEENTLVLKTDSTLRKGYITDLVLENHGPVPVIYPNPANQQIHFSGFQYPLMYKLINNNGIIVEQGVLDANTPVCTAELKEGIYYLEAGKGRYFIFSKIN